MSDTPSDIADNSPLALAKRVKGYIGMLVSRAQGMLHPHEDPQDRSPLTQMEYGASKTLRTHIQRIEYQLRCYILWLAARMIERAANEPRYLAKLRNLTSKTQAQPSRANCEDTMASNHNNTQAQSSRATALSPFHVCGTQTGTESNDLSPFHACETHAETRPETLNLRGVTADTVSCGGFQVIPSYPSGRHGTRNRTPRYTPDPLQLVDGRALLARLRRLPRILKKADTYAIKIALDAQKSPPRFAPFGHWLPPEALWASTDDEGERSDLNLLHYLASSALIHAGHGPPEDVSDDLPDLSVLDPPPPPQIRLLCHP